MDKRLNSVKLSITTATKDLQQEFSTVSQSQATQAALAVCKEIKEVQRLISELQRDAERQIANDPNANSKNTGIGAGYLKELQETFVGLSEAAYADVKQANEVSGKRTTLADCRKKNLNAPPKVRGKSRDKQKIEQLELKVELLEAENKNLKDRVQQLEFELGI